jgi:hypothetical protein
MNGQQMLSRKQCRDILEISSRATFVEYVKLLGLQNEEFFNWQQVKRIIELQSFLGLNRKYKREEFLLIEPQALNEKFQRRGVNINLRLENVQKEFNERYKPSHNINFQVALEN